LNSARKTISNTISNSAHKKDTTKKQKESLKEPKLFANMKKKWETYEEVARYLLDEIAHKFDLSQFEGKQKIDGKKSGTKWEIDAKGVKDDSDIFFIVECRRYRTSRQSQEKIGALAYKIQDTGASGGIIVSPLGMQEGAKKIAESENIHEVQLDPESTTENYVMQFLNEILVGITEKFRMKDSVDATLYDKNGNIVDRNKIE
jgi:hypothetical protein